MTEKQKFHRLYSFVCEDIPTSAVDELARRGYPLPTTAIMQVRQGRVINLDVLVNLVRLALPAFQIPDELLPAQPLQAR